MGSIPRLSASGADLTAAILAWFSVGLAAFSVFQYVVRCFYALSDTRTPFRLALVQHGLVVGLGVVLAPTFGVRGLAAAYAVAFLVSAVVAFAAFAKRVGRLPVSSVRPVGAMLVAAVAMATVAAAAVALVRWDGRAVAAPVQSAVGVAVAVAVYPAYLWAFRADADLRTAARLLRRVLGRR
jgi:putative peptidoglycan lipid II flippase